MPVGFKIGDVISGPTKEGQIQLHKILRMIQTEEGTHYHTLRYPDQPSAPELHQIDQLPVWMPHVQFDDLSWAEFVINRNVTDAELDPYLDYLKDNDFEAWCEETGRDVEMMKARAQEAFGRGNASFDSGDFERAVAAYVEAIDANPSFWPALDNMGLAKLQKGRYADAIDDFRWSLKLNANNAMAQGSIGEAYYRMGDYESAVEQFDAAIALDEENAQLQLLREKALFLSEGGTLEDLERAMNAPEPEPEVEVVPEPLPPVAEESHHQEEEPAEEEPPRKGWWPFGRKK